MLESSRRNPARRSIAVESVRFLAADVALADGRYTQKGQAGGKDREMWTAITLKRGAGRLADRRDPEHAAFRSAARMSETAESAWGRTLSR